MPTGHPLQLRVISLTGSHDRRRLVESNLSELDIEWRFLDALRGDAPCAYASDPARQIVHFGRTITPNEIGCFKSHVAAMQEFSKDQHLQWLLVMEDDVCIDPQFNLHELIKLLEKIHIEYIRLYSREYKKADHVAMIGQRQIIRFRTDPYGSQAYLISRSGANRFLSSIKSIDMPIDDALGRFWANGLPIYAVFPFPTFERSIASTIGSSRDTHIPKQTYRRLFFRIRSFALKSIHNFLWYTRKRRPMRIESRNAS